MESGLEEIALAGIFRIKEVEQLENKAVVNVGLGNVCVEILAFDEAQEELVNDLNVGPGNLKHGLVLFWVKGFALRVHRRRDRSEEVFAEHVDHLGVHGLGDDLSVVSDVVKQLVQSQSLNFLCLHVATGVVEVENDVALLNLLHKKLLASVGRDFVKAG